MSLSRQNILWAASQYGADPGVLAAIDRLEGNGVNKWDSNWRAGHPSEGEFQFIPSTFASFARQAAKANPNAWRGIAQDIKDPRAQALATAWALKAGHGKHWSTYDRALANKGKLGKAGKPGPTLGLVPEGPETSTGEHSQPVSVFAGLAKQSRRPRAQKALGLLSQLEQSQQSPVGASPAINPSLASAAASGADKNDLLSIARREVGTTAAEAMKYIKAAGGTGQEPWCGDFVQYVFQQRGLKPPPARSVPTLLNWAKKNKRFSKTAQGAGNLAMFDWDHDGTPDHVGFYAGGSGKGIQTIEGNTSGAGGRGVYEKTRNAQDILGYVT